MPATNFHEYARNAAHRPPLTQAEHKHTPAGVEVRPVPTLAQVVDEIMRGMQP